MPAAMVGATGLSVAFSALSGLIALFLAVLALRGRRSRPPGSLDFVAAAFALFAIKSFVVAYALDTDAIGHSSLELLDAMGDLGALLLLAMPVFTRT